MKIESWLFAWLIFDALQRYKDKLFNYENRLFKKMVITSLGADDMFNIVYDFYKFLC